MKNKLTPQTVRIAMITGLLIYSIFGYLDQFTMLSNYHTAWVIRYLIIFPFTIIIYIISFTKIVVKYQKALLFLLLSFGQIGITAMIWISDPKDLAFFTYYAGLILIMLWGSFIFRLNLKTSIYFSISAIVFYNFTAIVKQQIAFSPNITEEFTLYLNNNFFLISSAILILVGTRKLDKRESRLLTISQELKSDKLKLEKAQQSLKESEQKARIALNTSKDNILLCSPEGIVYDCNDAFCNIMALKKENIIGNNHLNLFKSKQKKNRENKLQIVFETKKALEFIDEGENYIFQTNIIPIFDDKGNIKQIAIYSRNITEQKKAEQLLKDSKVKLDKSNKTKDRFLSIIAHDLKNPIGTMQGFSELLYQNFDKNDSQTNKEFIGHIYNTTQNTYKLLENLLLWSNTQNENFTYKPEKENLYLLTNETVELLSQSAISKSISISIIISTNIYVFADRNMLLTIIRNLVSNAIKFTPKGGQITINAKVITDKNKIDLVEISVKDNGIGIEPAIQSKLFNLAENTLSKGTENETGTGLGLVLCNEFVKKHGGEIWVKSELGIGSEFLFTIPQ